MAENYLNPLPSGISLQVFNGENLIFESSGKWLHPLFDFEKFLASYDGPRDDLRSHDTAIGKAAAVLSVRAGIRKINAELLSQNAKNYIENNNKQLSEDNQVQVCWKNLIPKLMCATENQLENLNDNDEMYFLLRQRAKLVQGVEVSVKNLIHPYICKNSGKFLDFEVKAGGHLMICGENGVGKSTLLKILAGVEKNKKGEILIDGKNISSLEKFTIGYIPQFSEGQKFSLSVEEVTGLGCKNKKNVEQALARTSSLNLKGRAFDSLSGGEKQKIQLSRCLAQNAKLLLLDEPTASLDTENKKMVVDILRSLTISEIPTIIVVTHDKELTKMHGWDVMELNDD